MSFRKRNTVISASTSSQAAVQSRPQATQIAGLRPSPLDGRLTTSTGTASLDSILAGHAGLPLGTTLLVEEHGTTDFSGILLKYFAAEGLLQGHQVHVLGYTGGWKYELPAVSTKPDGISTKAPSQADGKMKIAWRYEGISSRNTLNSNPKDVDDGSKAVFCHMYDLTKRLASSSVKGSLHATPTSSMMSLAFENKQTSSAFRLFIKELQAKLQASSSSSVHRIVIPSLLSPTLYTPEACQPSEALQFLHAIRALQRQYPDQLTALMTLPVSLFPRGNGLTRWIELLSDGVLEMIPLPPKLGAPPPASSGASKVQDQSQGILRVHSLPVFHEKGGGGAENNHFREDLSFHMSSTKGLVIQPYVLPPLEEEDHHEKSPASTVKDGLEF